MLGAFEGVEWQDVRLALSLESTLLLYTDGVTDAMGQDGERYGHVRLRATLDGCRELSASKVIERVEGALSAFQVGAHADDMAVLALRSVHGASDQPQDRKFANERSVNALAGSSQARRR